MVQLLGSYMSEVRIIMTALRFKRPGMTPSTQQQRLYASNVMWLFPHIGGPFVAVLAMRALLENPIPQYHYNHTWVVGPSGRFGYLTTEQAELTSRSSEGLGEVWGRAETWVYL